MTAAFRAASRLRFVLRFLLAARVGAHACVGKSDFKWEVVGAASVSAKYVSVAKVCFLMGLLRAADQFCVDSVKQLCERPRLSHTVGAGGLTTLDWLCRGQANLTPAR